MKLSDFHFKVASNKESITTRGLKLFGVSETQFQNWRWQMKHQIQTLNDIKNTVELTPNEKEAFPALAKKFHAGISPYSFSLINFSDENDPVRLQLLPKLEELSDQFGVPDPLQEIPNSPVKELVHVYKDRVAWCVAQLCPVYCRYCFRKRRDGEEGLHFNQKIIEKGLEYIDFNKNIRDVLITGGDPFIAQDSAIENLLKKLRTIKHVEIIRFGTRTPVSLPYRFNDEFADMLANYHPIWINTHFNHAAELTPEAACAIDILLRRGIPIGNQSVFLKGVNDSVEKMRDLVNGLVRMRVRPYYIYHPQIVDGSEHLRIPIEKGLDIMRNLRGSTTGFAIPQYVLDTPTGKIPISPNHILGRDENNIILKQLNKELWAEPSPLGAYIPEENLEFYSSLHANKINKI